MISPGLLQCLPWVQASLTSRYLPFTWDKLIFLKPSSDHVAPLLNVFWILCCVYRRCPVELSLVMEMFYICTVQYGNHQPHEAMTFTFYPILINLNVNRRVWLLAGQCRKPLVCHLRLPLALYAIPAPASTFGILGSGSFKASFLGIPWQSSG